MPKRTEWELRLTERVYDPDKPFTRPEHEASTFIITQQKELHQFRLGPEELLAENARRLYKEFMKQERPNA